MLYTSVNQLILVIRSKRTSAVVVNRASESGEMINKNTNPDIAELLYLFSVILCLNSGENIRFLLKSLNIVQTAPDCDKAHSHPTPDMTHYLKQVPGNWQTLKLLLKRLP
jgi:hypothetical protein